MTEWKKPNLLAFNDSELQSFVDREEKAFSALEWSETALTLSKLVDQYILPQIVRIEDGYYSQEEDSSLSSGQILKIHCLKSVKKVSGRDQYGGEVHVPLNTITRVELRPENYDEVYDTVYDLAHAKPIPKVVEATRGYYNPAGLTPDSHEDLTVDPGEKLEVLGQVDSQLFPRPGKEKYMAFRNSKGNEFKLPFNSSPGFIPLLGMSQHVLGEAVNEHKLPIYASFTEIPSKYGHLDSNDNHLSKFGVVKFKEIYNEDLVVASCGHQSVRVVFTIPKNIDVTIRVAKGALTNDPEYAGLCQGYNNYKRIEELTIKRHERDIYHRSGEVRGYEYYLQSMVEGSFVGMDDDIEADQQVNHEKDDNDGSNSTESEDEYVCSDKPTTHYPKVASEKKKTATLPYEVTDIKINDFKKGGKYSAHLSGRSNSISKKCYNLQQDVSLFGFDNKSIKLAGIRTLKVADGKGMVKDVQNEDGPFGAECDEDGYLVAHHHTVQPLSPVECRKREETCLGEQSATRPAFPESIAKPESATLPVMKIVGPKPISPKGPAPKPFPPKPVLPKPTFTKPVPPRPMSPKETEVSRTTETAPTGSNQTLDAGKCLQPDTQSFKIPSDLSKLTTREVCICLQILHLNHLVGTFTENQVNGDLWVSLEDEDYKDLQLTNFERKKMARFVQGWRPDGHETAK